MWLSHLFYKNHKNPWIDNFFCFLKCKINNNTNIHLDLQQIGYFCIWPTVSYNNSPYCHQSRRISADYDAQVMEGNCSAYINCLIILQNRNFLPMPTTTWNKNFNFNSIQAGVFWNHILCAPPPSVSPLFVVQLPPRHDSNMAQNLSKTVEVKSIMTSLWQLWRHLCPVEYQKLLKTVYIQIGAASLSFIQSYSNLANTLTVVLL